MLMDYELHWHSTETVLTFLSRQVKLDQRGAKREARKKNNAETENNLRFVFIFHLFERRWILLFVSISIRMDAFDVVFAVPNVS